MVTSLRSPRVLRAVPRIAATVFGALGLVLSTAPPASAHGLGGPGPTDQLVTVAGTRPAISGVTVRTVDLGSRIRLTNRSDSTVVVIGYEREPYLRIRPDGVWVNRRSPATFLNRTSTPDTAAPDDLDPAADPRWSRVSRDPMASWHDHRAHWMGRGAAVDERWEIPLLVDGAPARIVGTLDSRAAPNTAAWLGLAAALALGLALLAGIRRWGVVLAAGLVLVIVGETVHTVGAWGAWDAATGRRLLGAAPSLLAIGLAIVALAVLVARRRNPDAATPLILIAGLFVALAGGLADLGSLTHAIPPSTLAPGLARLTVAIALGGGVGLVIDAARHLRPVGVGVAAPPPAEVGG